MKREGESQCGRGDAEVWMVGGWDRITPKRHELSHVMEICRRNEEQLRAELAKIQEVQLQARVRLRQVQRIAELEKLVLEEEAMERRGEAGWMDGRGLDGRWMGGDGCVGVGVGNRKRDCNSVT